MLQTSALHVVDDVTSGASDSSLALSQCFPLSWPHKVPTER
jgi:hypothetical protein